MSMDQKFIESLENIRRMEFERTLARLATLDLSQEVLEIGSGTGFQLHLLSERFSSAVGVDLVNSNYTKNRIANVIDYDGFHLPFGDKRFKYVFSSNVLEHIPHLQEFQSEISRVLDDNGYCLHIVPTAKWRFWAMLVHYLTIPKIAMAFFRRSSSSLPPDRDACNNGIELQSLPIGKNRSLGRLLRGLLMLGRHGERGNRLTELWFLRVKCWRSFFEQSGWEIVQEFPTGVFYTGHHFFGSHLSSSQRVLLAKVIGSACQTYVLKKKSIS